MIGAVALEERVARDEDVEGSAAAAGALRRARVAAWPSFPWKNPTLSAGAHVRSSRRQFSRRLAGATTSAGSFTGAPFLKPRVVKSFWLATSAASALVCFFSFPTDAHPPTPFSFRRREHARYATVCAVFPRPISSARIAPGTSCSSSNSRKLTPIIWYGLSVRARDASPAISKTSSAVTSARAAADPDRFAPPGDRGPSRRATSRPSASRRRREICAHRASAGSSGYSAYASNRYPRRARLVTLILRRSEIEHDPVVARLVVVDSNGRARRLGPSRRRPVRGGHQALALRLAGPGRRRAFASPRLLRHARLRIGARDLASRRAPARPRTRRCRCPARACA